MSCFAKIMIFVSFITACGQNTEFYAKRETPQTGGVTTSPQPPTKNITVKAPITPVSTPQISPAPPINLNPVATPIPAPAPSMPPLPPPCTDLPQTTAALKTSVVSQGNAARFIDYDISIVDCNGLPVAFNADLLLFDYDGRHLEFGANTGIMKFKITNPVDSQTIVGTMNKVTGSDLFNRIGSQWEHYATDKIIAFTNPTQVFHLQMDFSSVWISAPINSSSYTSEGYMLISTFLKFGNTQPVEGDVIFR